MRAMLAITRREMLAFFGTPIPYFVASLFLVVFGFVFAANFEVSFLLTLAPVFGSGAMLSIFFVPLLTMRLFAEEKATGSIETLLTAPVSDVAVVLGKFFAAFTFFVFMITPTLLYYVLLRQVGRPDVGPMIAQYLGLLFVGALYVSVGFLASTFTRTQVLSAVIAIVILIALWGLPTAANGLVEGDRTSVLFRVAEYISPGTHLDAFFRGQIDPTDVVYFVSFTAYFLFVGVRSVETRKWL